MVARVRWGRDSATWDRRSAVLSDESDNLVVIADCQQDDIFLTKHKKNAQPDSNTEFKIISNLTNPEPGVNVRLAERLRQQGGRRPDFVLYAGVKSSKRALE